MSHPCGTSIAGMVDYFLHIEILFSTYRATAVVGPQSADINGGANLRCCYFIWLGQFIIFTSKN